MLRYSYAMFCFTCLYGLTRVTFIKSMESTKILLCAVLLWNAPPPKVIVTVSEVTATARILGLQELTVIACLMLLCP